MRAAVVVITAALLAFAAARCPNSCSGHGDCGGSDKCSCWPNWQGFDCSERTCEYDVAWATDARQNPHYYAECSGKGICDRTTGLCTCFDGYTGSACRRSVCPNDCSGHGKCRLIAELGDANSAQSVASNDASTEGSLHQYARWDGDKIQACVCDGGFFGPDCSQRNCPKGDDPLTICNAATQQVQTLTVSSSYSTLVQAVDITPPAAGLPIKGSFTLTANADTSSSLTLPISGSSIATTLQTDWATPAGNPYVVTGGSGSSAATSWVITFTDSEALITGSNAALYSPTGAITTTLVAGDGATTASVLTIHITRTAVGTPVAGNIRFSIGGGASHVDIPIGASLATTVASFTGAGAFQTFITANGFTAITTTPPAAGGASPHGEDGTVVITFEIGAGDDTAAATVDATFPDITTAHGTLPTITVSDAADGAYAAALTTGPFQGELVLHFTDSEGEVWTTSRIGDAGDATNDFFKLGSNTAGLIATALAGIPNFKVPKVTVTETNAGSDNVGYGFVSHGWKITFDNERNSGVQNLLACDPLPLGCQTAGCSPMYQQPKTWATSATSPSSWTSAHHRIEYAKASSASAFASATFTDSATGSGTPAVPGSVPSFSTLITDDSILDNSAWDFDQATVLIRVYKVAYGASNVNWGYRTSDVYAYYTVEWDYNSMGIGASSVLPASTCGVDGSSCTIHYIPTGKATATTAHGSTDVGVGFNHAPIGNGLYVDFGDALAGLATSGSFHEELYIAFDVATVRCDVAAAAPAAEYEHLECSGRGSCDRTSGTCTCFEGHYGDHCGMQTILV